MCIFKATFVYADFRRSGDSASVYFRSRIRVNVEFPLTLPKKLGLVGNIYTFFNFMCYFMRTLVEMLIFILYHKASSKLFNDQQICRPHSVVL